MELDVISYDDLRANDLKAKKKLEQALLQKGIVGIRDVPQFEMTARTYIYTARKFSSLSEHIKQQYKPNRDSGDTEGYELGAEWFKNQNDEWQIDDKKASFYAFVPDQTRNKWPKEVDLKTAYLALGKLIFDAGKHVLNAVGLNEATGLDHNLLTGYGRMLHYHKESDATNANPDWCGAHFDHSVFTGLIPAYYFRDGKEIDEPEEAGLFITPSEGGDFEKIYASDKSVLLFQVGEFGQLASNDRIKATRHRVKKALGNIERFTFALFYSAFDDIFIQPRSILTQDKRFIQCALADGRISYRNWATASFEGYRAKTKI